MGVTTPRLRRDVQPKPASRTGDRVLLALCVIAGLIVAVTLVDIGYQLVNSSRPAIDKFGLGFLVHQTWAPNFKVFGAADMIVGTVVSSLIAIVIAAPLGLAIAVYLSMIAPQRVTAIVAPLV